MKPHTLVLAVLGAAAVYVLAASAAYVWAQERDLRRRLALRPGLFLEKETW